jgi:hypothetical protein
VAAHDRRSVLLTPLSQGLFFTITGEVILLDAALPDPIAMTGILLIGGGIILHSWYKKN